MVGSSDVGKDVVAVSMPFVAGVALASVISFHMFAAGLTSILIPILICVCVLRNGRCFPALAALCFVSGMFCYVSRAMSASPAGLLPASGLPLRALDALLSLIDSIAFPGDDTADMVKALLTGRREGLGPEVRAAFRSSGASHILALSGLHLGVIYAIMSRLLSFMGNSVPARIARSVLVVAASGFYVLMTGMGPSLVRAFFFICLNEICRCAGGRVRNPVSVFCASLTIQLSLDPLAISSAGFQLSYLAMAGIVLLFPRLDAMYPPSSRFDPLRWIWSSAMLSVSCQVFTAPVAWLRFHTFPKYFLITNLVALPLTGLIMMSAVTTICLTALGICPPFLVLVTDKAVSLLLSCLGTISGM